MHLRILGCWLVILHESLIISLAYLFGRGAVGEVSGSRT